MRFAEPAWLAAAPIMLLGLRLAFRRSDARRRTLLASFVGDASRSFAASNANPKFIILSRVLKSAAVAALAVALARPMIFRRAEPLELQGIPYLVALDASRSMLARDVPPSRWAAATNALDRFLSKSKGDRVGLVTFAGVAYLNAPLTFDTYALRSMLHYLDPNSIEDAGSSLASAIERASRYFESNHVDRRLLLVISDGEDLAGSPLEVARRAARKTGLKICTVGVGTATGAKVPLDRYGRASRNAFGQEVLTRLNESNLERLAAITDGQYFRIGRNGEGLDTFRREVLTPMAESAARDDLRNYKPFFEIPALVALACLVGDIFIGSDRRTSLRRAAPIRPSSVIPPP
jgi:Ca-activated chloride channel homolog